MEEIIANVTASGFPVAVAVYLLVRMERELSELRRAIETLRRCQHCKYERDVEDDNN